MHLAPKQATELVNRQQLCFTREILLFLVVEERY